MKEFLLLFRHEAGPRPEMTPEEQAAMMKPWQDWIGGIAAQGKFVSTNPLQSEGKVIRAGGSITDGPYTELKEVLGGYLLLKADDLEDAMKMANECPIVGGENGGTVEVRETQPFSF